ncbi:MAG: hypothetical protein R8P61_30970 [Bacteroidia bacterium]|nr:hypothetical protein [Bacteroidia bacterium]
MKSCLQLLLVLSIPFFVSCAQNRVLSPLIDPDPVFSGQIEVINSSNDYVSRIKSWEVNRKNAGWYENRQGGVMLTLAIYFDVELENGEKVELGFGFNKLEGNRDLLILDDPNNAAWDRNWEYKSMEDEANFFFGDFDEARVTIGNNVSFHQGANPAFQITDIKTAMVDGVERNHIQLTFEGLAFGWYDPDGQYQEVYKFIEGSFEGVVE